MKEKMRMKEKMSFLRMKEKISGTMPKPVRFLDRMFDQKRSGQQFLSVTTTHTHTPTHTHEIPDVCELGSVMNMCPIRPVSRGGISK